MTLILIQCTLFSQSYSNTHPSNAASVWTQTPSSSSPGFGYDRQWGSIGGLSSPNGVAVDTSGNLYLADARNYAVGKMASNGVFISAWGGYGTGTGQFKDPFGI